MRAFFMLHGQKLAINIMSLSNKNNWPPKKTKAFNLITRVDINKS